MKRSDGRVDRVGERRIVVAASESGVDLGQRGLARRDVTSVKRVDQVPGQAVGVPAGLGSVPVSGSCSGEMACGGRRR